MRKRPRFNKGYAEIDDSTSSGYLSENAILEWIKKMFEKIQDKGITFEVEHDDKNNKKPLKALSLLGFSIIKLKNLKLAKILLDLGCDINETDIKGHTIMTYAIKKNNKILLEFLQDYTKKINFNIIDKEKKSYIHLCVSPMKSASFQNRQLLRYLSKYSDLDLEDIHGKPAIFYAEQQENKKMFNELKKLGAKEFDGVYIKKKEDIIFNSQILKDTFFNYEEDYENYCKTMKELLQKSGIKIENKQKLDTRIIGKVEKVYDERGDPYIINLTKVDVHYGYYSTNLYYKMQIAKDIVKNIYVLFTNWGRIGTNGQYQLTPFFSFEECKKEFEQVFKEKTKNLYENRDDFQKFSRKYRLVKFKKTFKNKNILRAFDLKDFNIKKSYLPEEIYNLIVNLTDNKYYRVVYENFKLDEDMIPMGNLTKETILKGKHKLKEIIELLEDIEENKKKNIYTNKDLFDKFTDISIKTSDYYELIPSVLNKTGAIPVLNMNNSKNEMSKLLDLENFEMATKIMCAANLNPSLINPLDYTFKCLKMNIKTLKNNSEEFTIIKKYFNRGLKKNSQKFKINNIFAIERKGESSRFQQWSQNTNKRLLWHGTRTENIISILKEGLRIAPVTSTQTGNMFNSGVYFSDVSGKSINYSSNYYNTIKKPIYILLCEVALGKMYKLYKADNELKLKKGYDSVKGCGKTTPDKFQRVYFLDGTMVPIGCLETKEGNPPPKSEIGYYSLNYNEYVVYNTSQVRMRYLLEVMV